MSEAEKNDPKHFRLLILGDGSVRTVSLTGQRWVIGRSSECSIPLRDPTVSRKHLLLERTAEGFRFQDLGGANPVLHEGRPARQGLLQVGQPLILGLTRLVVEERRRPNAVETGTGATIVISREIAEDEVSLAREDTFTATATNVLLRIEWTFADLGDLADAAEPLLELAINLTARQAGWIARFHPHGATETLAAIHVARPDFTPHLAESALRDALRIAQPHLLTTREAGGERQRLLIPMGEADSSCLMVLEDPTEGATSGQELLRLAGVLGRVIWHRLQETLERQRLRDELARLRFRGTMAHNALMSSTRLQAARELLRAVATGHDPLLLIGEPGTEREDLARFLHTESPRQGEPFRSWNAGQVAASNHADELLGNADTPGLLRRADGGTLLIDDLHKLSPALQTEMLDVLSSLPEHRRPRLVAAVDPGDATLAKIDERLRIDPVRIPPLRDDARDVLTLAELFLSELGPCADGSARLMTERTKRALVQYSWPGNVRELRLTIEAATANAGSQPIAPRHLPKSILTDDPATPAAELPTLEEVEREHIQEVMRKVGGVRARAAQVLGIANSTLYEKIKRYRIEG